MSKLTVFHRQASIGDVVTLRLSRGEDVTGRITELDDHHVCLDLGQRVVTIFEDILVGWDIHKASADAQKTTERSQGRTLALALTPSPNLEDPAIWEHRARIDAIFSEGARRARLEPPRIDFTFPSDEFPSASLAEVRREWDRARNQFDYAVKMREESRLLNIVGQVLQPLSNRYPNSSSIHNLLGHLLQRLGRQTEAVEHFRRAASVSRSERDWYALAQATSGTAAECYALRNYFLVRRPAALDDAWLRYFAVARINSDAKGMIQVLEPCFDLEPDNASRKVATETLVFVLGQIGAIEAAQAGAVSLVRGEVSPVDGWRDLLQKAFPHPSPELVQEEKRDTLPSRRPARSLTVPSGKIVSFFYERRFGFIDGDDGETYFFRADDVTDEALKQSLLDGAWRHHRKVEFERNPSPGHKYQRAVRVKPLLEDASELLSHARQLLRLSLHAQAMALVRWVLTTDPHNADAHELEQTIKKEIRSLGIGLPKGHGPYARAKRAQLVDQDLSSAEHLFREAIKCGDMKESATKDLASLLQQQERHEEALSLLESARKGLGSPSPYDNMLATLYQQLGRHDEAIRLLDRLVRVARGQARAPLLRRIAFSQFKAGRYDEAEHTLRALLKENPVDSIAERWLAGLEEARRGGSYAEAAEIIGGFGGLAESGLELSPLAQAAIAACRFEGVDPSKLKSGKLTLKDIEELENLAKELGTRRPRDRAAYYLSAASLSRQLAAENAPRADDYLRRYFASLGDAAWIDRKPADVVRTFYVESLALVADLGLDEAWRTLIRYLATFSTAELGAFEETLPRPHGRGAQPPRSQYVSALSEVLANIQADQPENYWRGLLDVSSQSSFARKALVECLIANPAARAPVASFFAQVGSAPEAVKSFWDDQSRSHFMARRKILDVCQTLTRYQLTTASMEELVDHLHKVDRAALTELDRRRLSELLEIAEAALGFCRAADFEDKEQHYWLITTRVGALREQVQMAPTQLSHAGFLPIAEHLTSITEEQFAHLARTSGAQLHLRLLVDEYVRGRRGEVKLQVEVSNRSGCSPASNVSLHLGPEDSPYFDAGGEDHEIAPTLRGGASIVSHVVVKLRDSEAKELAFPIRARARFRNRLGEDCSTDDVEWTVRLYGPEVYREILNPYAPYSEGGPVDNEKMFFGRAELLARLENSLLAGSSSKCVVVFGQKRAGKSSLLEHLRRRLATHGGCVPVQFSLYEVGSTLDEPSFFYRVMKGVSDALAELRATDTSIPSFTCPSLSELRENAALRFHDEMGNLSRELRGAAGDRRLSLVLLIDEFTEIYKQIRKGLVRPEFMKAWKAVVEKRYFASVLVGQDIMPAFKAAFPNEFGVTEDVRVTYLTDAEAKKLIEEPVGAGHFAGNAIPRILALTAGSPFYTMMLCDRLVDYMNRTRSAVVTEADVAAVEQEMIAGDRRLTRDKFDNLLCAGDGVEDSGIDPDETLRLCGEIAKKGQKGWCSLDALCSFEKEKVDALLTDLERRDVVERKGDTYRLRVGLFHDWLMVQG